jgi:hypothetical protein
MSERPTFARVLMGATRETRLGMAMAAAENLLAALLGETPPNLVNPLALESGSRFANRSSPV